MVASLEELPSKETDNSGFIGPTSGGRTWQFGGRGSLGELNPPLLQSDLLMPADDNAFAAAHHIRGGWGDYWEDAARQLDHLTETGSTEN